jgi:hypothetical protein
LTGQGYPVDTLVLYQDNTSAILLETNGQKSSTKRTRHMNIRFFYIKDHVDSGTVKVDYCNTDEMIGDLFTKPLQGKKFKKFRDMIMNIPLNSKYSAEYRSVWSNEEESDETEENELEDMEENVSGVIGLEENVSGVIESEDGSVRKSELKDASVRSELKDASVRKIIMRVENERENANESEDNSNG